MVYLFLADGFEETEALVTVDLLRRASIDVVTAGVGAKTVTGSHGITVTADIEASDVDLSSCNGVILPGGMPGTNNLFASENVLNTVRYCAEHDLLTAAICAAPLILGRLGFLSGKKAVCFPGFENELSGAELVTSFAVRDGSIITAKGAGAVFAFAHEIISFLKNATLADKIIDDIQSPGAIR